MPSLERIKDMSEKILNLDKEGNSEEIVEKIPILDEEPKQENAGEEILTQDQTSNVNELDKTR